MVDWGRDYQIKTDIVSMKKYSQAVDISPSRILYVAGVENGEQLLTVSGSTNRRSHYEKSVVVTQKSRSRSAM